MCSRTWNWNVTSNLLEELDAPETKLPHLSIHICQLDSFIEAASRIFISILHILALWNNGDNKQSTFAILSLNFLHTTLIQELHPKCSFDLCWYFVGNLCCNVMRFDHKTYCRRNTQIGGGASSNKITSNTLTYTFEFYW